MRRLVFVLLTVVMLTGCGEVTPVSVDEQAARFVLPTLDGEAVSLESFEGQRVMLNFWATWCGPCREEMPHMQQAYETNEQVAIIAINMTEKDYGSAHIASFVEEFGLTFPIVLDELGEVAKQYGVLAIPTTVFIDEQGRITEKISGPLTAAQIEAYMQ